MYVYNHSAKKTEVVFSNRPNIYSRTKNMSNMSYCLQDIQNWIIQNKLQLNADKMEAMLVSTKHKLSSITTALIEFGNTSVPLATAVKYLGVVMDNTCKNSSPRPASHASINYGVLVQFESTCPLMQHPN